VQVLIPKLTLPSNSAVLFGMRKVVTIGVWHRPKCKAAASLDRERELRGRSAGARQDTTARSARCGAPSFCSMKWGFCHRGET
jgi:hypothetical protein